MLRRFAVSLLRCFAVSLFRCFAVSLFRCFAIFAVSLPGHFDPEIELTD